MTGPINLETLCELARLPLPEPESARGELQDELQRTLDFFGEIAAIETSGVEPLIQPLDVDPAPQPGTTHTSLMGNASLRDDVVVHGMDPSVATANAAETDGQYFLVPRVLK